MLEVLKCLTKEASCHAKENIDAKLNTIKNAIDWSNFEIDICNKIDLNDLYQDNQLNENVIWNSIAKLSIDLYLEYDYYKDFIFLNKHKGEEYDYRLRMLGYEEENGYWTSRRKPEKDLVIEYVFMSCLCRSIGKRLTIKEQRSGKQADIPDQPNAIDALLNAGDNVRICPFCDFELAMGERGCRQCEATEEDIASLFQNATDPVDNGVGIQTITLPVNDLDSNQLINDVISESRSCDSTILISSNQPEALTAPPKPGDECANEGGLAAGARKKNAKAAIPDPPNAIRALSNAGDNVWISPFCNIGLGVGERRCRHCEATEEDIASLFQNTTEPVNNGIGIQTITLPVKDLESNQLVNDVISESHRCDVTILISSSLLKVVPAPLERRVTCTLGIGCTSERGITTNSADKGDTVTQASRDSQGRSDGVAEPLDRSTASDSHNGQGTSTLPELGDYAGTQMDSTNGWGCESCGMQNDESFLSCQACSVARVTTWTCMYCNIDYKLSIRKCEVCDREWEGVVKRIFCAWCRENEVLGNEICEECMGTQWLCWKSRCQGINYGRGQYCAYCGIDKDGDRSPGQPIRVLKDGRIDIKWICSLCGVMNDNYAAQYICDQCRGLSYLIEKYRYVEVGNPIGKPEKQVSINDVQPEPPRCDKLYESVSALEQNDLWKCKTCRVNNESSRKQCIACGRSRYCHRCGCEENIDEELCIDCVAQKWLCWYPRCRSTNFGTDSQYCAKCGLARETPRVSGEGIWQNVKGRFRLVWMCDHCWEINGKLITFCSGYNCGKKRNNDFVWCHHCGFGNPPNWTDWFNIKCKACDNDV